MHGYRGETGIRPVEIDLVIFNLFPVLQKIQSFLDFNIRDSVLATGIFIKFRCAKFKIFQFSPPVGIFFCFLARNLFRSYFQLVTIRIGETGGNFNL